MYQSFPKEVQISGPFVHFGLDRSHVTRAGDRGDVDVAVVQVLLDFVCAAQDKHVLRVLVGEYHKLCRLP